MLTIYRGYRVLIATSPAGYTTRSFGYAISDYAGGEWVDDGFSSKDAAMERAQTVIDELINNSAGDMR